MLKNFTVIELLDSHSESIANIKGNTVRFNPQTAAELDYAAYVQFLVLPRAQQFAIRPCKESDKNAVPFSKPKGIQQSKVHVTNAVIGKLIRRMAEWSPEENWNVPAVREPEEDVLIYDLKAARKPESRGGGWPVKRQREAEAAAAAEMEV